jgi:hypothetical protein
MAEKCAHPACKCKVRKSGEYGKYCSAVCQMKGTAATRVCECGHTDCR